MTLKWLPFTLFTSLSVFSFSQIKELKEASDKAEVKLTAETNKSKETLDLTQFVDPIIGTGGHGHTYPGPTVPFGMMQLSPDTRYEGWDGCSGYHYSDSVLYGFSHTHLSGTGVPDYCDLLIIPQSAKKPKVIPGYHDQVKGYGHRFQHEDESAKPGLYKVYLPDQKIHVRLTTTARAGLHEYTFEEKENRKYILIDLDHRDHLLAYDLNLINSTEISGFRVSSAWASEQHFYFHMALSQPYEKAKIIKKNGSHKLLLQFPETTDRILIRVGMSGVDMAGAKLNLETEMPDFQFEKYALAAKKEWNKELGKIEFESGDEEKQTIFYTSLYHTFLQPNIWNDIDGRYRGRDNQIHTLNKGDEQYTVFSLWDTFRAAHPLYTLIQQEKTEHFIRTFMRQFEEGGDLPVWELAANETECMIGYNSVSVLADAYIKGIRPVNGRNLLSAMKATSSFDELGKKQFRDQGFISSGDEPESVSKTLEYSYNEFCIAQLAKAIRDKASERDYKTRAFNFLNVYDASTKFMRARNGGFWHEPFDPSEVNFNYTEANSWQYSLFAPHAINVLADQMGGKDSLEAWLDRLFTTEMLLSGRHQVDITGLIGQYAHGNEPSHHMAYLYNYTNAPHKAEMYIDRIQKEMYTTLPDGLSGNEDCGQMSAWYVMSALGLYQVTPGFDFYDFGRPLMNKAVVHLENGNTLIFNSMNNSYENKYIKSVSWNGKTLTSPGITHEELMKGGELVYEMSDKPIKTFSTPSKSCYQTEDLNGTLFTRAPWFIDPDRVFENRTIVAIGSIYDTLGKVIYRYADEPMSWFDYTVPFDLTESAKIEISNSRTIVRTPENPSSGIISSAWISGSFVKRDPSVHLKLDSEYSNQYPGVGPETLIDGVEGGNEFRTGDYQGFWAKDVIATVNFDSPREIKEIGVSVLQDMKSWIFYPSGFQVEVSYDGKQFVKLGSFKDFPRYNEYVGPNNMNAVLPVKPKAPVYAIRIVIDNFGKCPAWHLGAGSDTWLFVDEIIFR